MRKLKSLLTESPPPLTTKWLIRIGVALTAVGVWATFFLPLSGGETIGVWLTLAGLVGAVADEPIRQFQQRRPQAAIKAGLASTVAGIVVFVIVLANSTPSSEDEAGMTAILCLVGFGGIGAALIPRTSSPAHLHDDAHTDPRKGNDGHDDDGSQSDDTD